MAQVHSSKHSLFDTMLEIITGHPINGLLFFLMLCGVFLSLVSVGVGLLLSLFIRWFRIPALWILIFGLVLVVSAWVIDGISVRVLHRLNDGVFTGLLHANLQPLQHIYVWLSAIPYGILFSALFSALLQHKSGLQNEIKRVARGKHNLTQRFICQKRLQRGFHHISQSAYDTGTIIGIDRVAGQPVMLTDSAANLHTLVVGTTGSGKTTGLGNIIESAIQRKLPLFYVDGKGDRNLAERVAQYSKQQGRPFYLFSMVGDSVKYNPLASGGFTSKKDRIVELRHWSEDHYRKLAESYL